MKHALRAAIISAVGPGVPVAWGVLPSPLLPAVVLNRISETAGITHSGESSLRDVIAQIDCYAATYDAADALWSAVHAAVRDFGGELLGVSDSVEGGAGDASRPFRASADYRLHYQA